MATAITTSPWTLLASHQIWSYSGRCTMHFQVFAYCTQDPINNRSTVYTRSRIAIVNNNPSYSGYSVTQTWKVGMTGAADYSWSGTIADAGAGVTSERILSNGSFTVNHDSNGNASSAVYYWFNGNYTGAIASPAAPNGVVITLPKIDRTAGTPTISNVSSTYNSASCNITVPFASTVNQYSRDGSNWSNWNKSVSANSAFSDSWSGLSPNTTYTFYYRFRRDYNQIWSPAVSFTVTTKKPAAGNASNNISISVSSTYNSATISLSGGSPGAGGSIGYYRINFNGGGYKQVSNPATFTGLSPNTTYNFSVDFVDNYGTVAAGSTSGSVTTKKPSAPSKGSVSVSNITYNGAKFTWSGFSFGAGATWGKYQYGCQDQGWIDCGTNTSITITDRAPNTSNTFYVRLVDNYGQVSDSATVTFTTAKPAAPSKGSVTVSSKTYNSITYSWSGFSFGAGGGWGKYQYSYDNSNWVDTGQNTSHTRSNLNPNTSYTLYVRLVDNYGTASAVASVAGTTNKPAAPTAGTISVSNITPFGATFSWSGFSFGAGATWGKYQYGWHDTEWYDCGQSTSITLSDRKPNTSNTFYVRLIDNYGTASPSATVVVKTLKPTAPTAGTILVKNTTHRGATLFWSGFAFGSGADFGKYQYNYNGFWIDCGTDTTVTLKNLSSNASYTFQVRLIDNYGTASNSVSITFKTKSEESWRYVNQYIKVNGTWKYGILYYKVDGVWKTVTGTYFKGRTPTVALIDSNGSILTDSNGIVLNAIQ